MTDTARDTEIKGGEGYSPRLYDEEPAPATERRWGDGTLSLSVDMRAKELAALAKNATGLDVTPGSFAAIAAIAATWVTYFAALFLNFGDFARPGSGTVLMVHRGAGRRSDLLRGERREEPTGGFAGVGSLTVGGRCAET